MQGQKWKYLQNNKPTGNPTFFQAVKQRNKKQYSFVKANGPMLREEHSTAVLLPKELSAIWMPIKTWGGWIIDWRSQNMIPSF